MKIYLRKGDITQCEVDVIVNAANSSLRGGGGVDGAIHRVGGVSILEECLKIGHCKTGDAVITGAGRLPAKKVIHAVGPVWRGGNNNEPDLLRSVYRTSLYLALDAGFLSIAFPNISTGIYAFPKQTAARIAVETVRQFANEHPNSMEVYFVCFDEENYRIYQHLLK